uniref:Uncharacterized protein n=1 Tax=Ditylenchus dipsaci TaxID=166011 RepID=A0A915EA33_9BILA
MTDDPCVPRKIIEGSRFEREPVQRAVDLIRSETALLSDAVLKCSEIVYPNDTLERDTYRHDGQIFIDQIMDSLDTFVPNMLSLNARGNDSLIYQLAMVEPFYTPSDWFSWLMDTVKSLTAYSTWNKNLQIINETVTKLYNVNSLNTLVSAIRDATSFDFSHYFSSSFLVR